MHRILTATLLATTLAAPAFAQWPAFTAPGIPKAPDGTPNLAGPAPRTADGKVDLTGVWDLAPPPRTPRPATLGVAATGTGEAPVGGGSVFFDVGVQTPGGAPYQPWAAELRKKRIADNSKDNPDALCQPLGIMQMTSHPYPRKFIQTPLETVIIYEGSGTTVREVYTDGRPLPPKDAEPWYNGYSVGRWEGDTFVIETTSTIDDTWLDVNGSPLTSAGRIIERVRRPTFGALEIQVTIDDPKAYTRPFSATVHYRLSVDTQLIEFVCNNNKSALHYVGAAGKPETK